MYSRLYTTGHRALTTEHPTKDLQVPISAVSTSSHSEQSSQARQSRWYCRNRWESRSVPNFIRKPYHGSGRALLFYGYQHTALATAYRHKGLAMLFLLTLKYWITDYE